jgi:hypothetical protein
MCGAYSAFGLDEAERELWPQLRDRLRQPHHLMGVMRGVLGSDAEVAVVVATSPAGVSQPLAVLVTPAIAAELTLPAQVPAAGVVRAKVGDYDVDALTDDAGRPIALLMTPWLFENLSVYARKLWSRR